MRKYDHSRIVLISALAESFLRKLNKQKFIQYQEGTEFFETKETLPESDLMELDPKTKTY